MKTKSSRDIADRSIKVDERTHRRLRIESARTGKTIAELVAELLKRRQSGEKASEQAR